MATDQEDRDTGADSAEGNEEGVDTQDDADTEEGADGAAAGDDNGDDSADDDKPVTKGELKSTLKSINDSLAVMRRHGKKEAASGKKELPTGKSGDGRNDADTRIDRLEQVELKRTFGYQNKLSPEEVDMVFKFDPKPSKKTLSNPFVQGGLDRLRSARNVDANVPGGGTGPTFKVDGKSWDDLTPAQKQANFAKRQDAILAGKGRKR